MSLRLTERQAEIVKYQEGALLVKAGPGSGKTRVLIERIKAILKERPKTHVLALTFSNMAADEMKNRLQDDGEVAGLLNCVTVGTIHSFALDLVQKRGNLIGLNDKLTIFENEEDRKTLLKDLLYNDRELFAIFRQQTNPNAFLSKLLNFIAEQKKHFITPELYQGDDDFKRIYEAYNDGLWSQNALDFDDILFFAYRILMENPRVQNLYARLYKYIFVDEAQDLNFAQYEVIKALCGEMIQNVMFVGDENQSIYAFNGSDSRLMTEKFVADFSPRIIVLRENFRSSKRIVAFANQLENTKDISNYVYEGELRSFGFHDEEEEAAFVLKSLQYFLRNGHADIENKVSFEDCAVIARTRYALANVENKLKEAGIPFYYKKSVNGIEPESDYLKVFDLSLRVFQNMKDTLHLRELCNLTGFDLTYNGDSIVLNKILSEKKYTGIAKSLKWMEDESFDFERGLRELEVFVTETDCFGENDKYLVLHDIAMWRTHWKKYISQVARENRSLVSFRNYIALGKTQDVSANKGVSLLTAHMSKGLQYEIVYVIGLNEGTFPDYRAIINGGKALEQEKNNMFVAVTRAKRICYLTFPDYKLMPWGNLKFQSKSRFIENVAVERAIL